MKLDLDVVAKEKRQVRGPIVTGCSPQWNFYPPIKFRRSFFVWLRSTSERGAGEKARCTRGRRRGQFLYGQRQSDFVPSCCLPYCGRSVRLVCLGKKQRIKKLKLSLLQVLCESLDLQAPIPPVRKKAPYVSLLQGVVIVLLRKFKNTSTVLTFFVTDAKVCAVDRKSNEVDRSRGLFIESLGNYWGRKTVLCFPCLYLSPEIVLVSK